MNDMLNIAIACGDPLYNNSKKIRYTVRYDHYYNGDPAGCSQYPLLIGVARTDPQLLILEYYKYHLYVYDHSAETPLSWCRKRWSPQVVKCEHDLVYRWSIYTDCDEAWTEIALTWT